MAKRIAIIQGHPDPAGGHLLHALGEAYAKGALPAGHELRRIEVAQLNFPLMRTQEDFRDGEIPDVLKRAREDMLWADHWVFLFPIWYGTMPALLKGFLEQVLRPGFAMEYRPDRFPRGLLSGKSARLIVTMGTPVWIYRWYFGGFGVRGFEHSILRFAGVRPVRTSYFGVTGVSRETCTRWLDQVRGQGERAA